MKKELNDAAQEYTEKGSKCQDEMDAFIGGAQWLGKQMIAKLKFASDVYASTLNREPKNETALFLMNFSEAQIQQVLNLMRTDKPLYRDDILKEIGYVSPIKKQYLW